MKRANGISRHSSPCAAHMQEEVSAFLHRSVPGRSFRALAARCRSQFRERRAREALRHRRRKPTTGSASTGCAPEAAAASSASPARSPNKAAPRAPAPSCAATGSAKSCSARSCRDRRKACPFCPRKRPQGLTERQLIERHSSDAQCASCHQRIDPFGFALEGFDAIGRARTKDAAGLAIDTQAKLADGTEIDGLDGLRTYLLSDRRDDFLRAVLPQTPRLCPRTQRATFRQTIARPRCWPSSTRPITVSAPPSS